MLSYNVYKVLHLTGVFLVLISLSATAFHVMSGGTKATNQFRKKLGILHGVGLLIALVAGFGLLARLQIFSTDMWIALKIAIWICFGLASALLYRKPKSAKAVFWLTIVLAVAAAFLAIYKPA